MTKNVKVRVQGTQYLEGNKSEKDVTVTESPGTYYLRDGAHFILYDEEADSGVIVKNMVRFNDATFEITKKGPITSKLVFEPGKKNISDYKTPYGNFLIGVNTQFLQHSVTEEKISISIAYTMEMDGAPVARNLIDITVKPDGGKA